MSKLVLLCLHGWGGSQESFTELRDALRGADVNMLTPDLPGFGAESEPDRPWTVDDYAAWVEEYAESHGITRCHLLGHSHGGRIAIKLALRKRLKIDHLYLCAAAGIRRKKHFKRIAGLLIAKTGKPFLRIPGIKKLALLGKKLLYKMLQVHDYEKASPLMRQTLINVSREDLRPLLSKIKTATDIFWGTEDTMTPIADAKIMHEAIKESTLHTFPGVRHRVHRDRAAEIADVIHAKISGT